MYDDIFYGGVAGRETRNALGCVDTSTVWNRITRKNIGTYRYGLSRIEPEPDRGLAIKVIKKVGFLKWRTIAIKS